MENVDVLFKNFLDEISQSVGSTAFYLWFNSLKPISFVDDKITILVPMEVYKYRLESDTYKDAINNAWINTIGKTINIEYVTEEELNELPKLKTVENNEISNNNDVIDNITNESWDSNLNPKFTFDNFVVGESNKFAVVSAKDVAQNPGTLHNPFFLYGRSGIGKTHLMQAIGNYIKDNSNKKVLYVTSNDFISDYAGFAYVEKGEKSFEYSKNFNEKYRNIDVLIIDDIQFLVTADKSQQEFFNIFNNLYQSNKQIIISSDKSPDDLKKLEERLRSRFMWGLPIDIYPPDFNLRCKIIRSKLKGTTLEEKLDQQTIEYIANTCQTDVRFIEGTLNRLMAYTAMMVPSKIDLAFTMEALKDYCNQNVYADNSIAKIQASVAKYYNITVSDLKSKKKTANIVNPRHIAIYLCRILTDESLGRIGQEFGGRDHSTVSASYDKISEDIKNNPEIKSVVDTIKNML